MSVMEIYHFVVIDTNFLTKMQKGEIPLMGIALLEL